MRKELAASGTDQIGLVELNSLAHSGGTGEDTSKLLRSGWRVLEKARVAFS